MTSAQFKKTFVYIILLLFTACLIFAPRVSKAADTCTATVSPNSVTAGTQQNFTFNVNNTGTAGIIYIKVTRPSSNFTLYNSGGVPSPWQSSITSTQAELYNGTISPTGSLSFSIGANIGSTAASSANWTVEIVASGDIVACTGTLGTEITGAGDTTPPSLSQPSVSGITNSSGTVTWTTDESSSSTVNYGTTLSYGSTLNDASLVTTHSITLTGLTADTTYYFTISSTDANANTANASGYNFTTASASTVVATTATPTSGISYATVTPTSGPTATPTPTPIPVDRTAPKVTITTSFEGSVEEVSLIEGTATDDKVVTKIDYSTDGGENWLPVDDSEGLNTDLATFSFTPYIFDDGNYDIIVRAIDANSNEGRSDTLVLVIDRLPPQVGGNLISLGPQILLPNEDGVIVTIAGLQLKITLSAVGGPTSIDLYLNNEKFPLDFSNETGLWSGYLTLSEVGLYQLKTEAIDGAGNRTERDLNPVLAVEPGVIKDADSKKKLGKGEVTLYVKDTISDVWAVWDGATFGQENPQKVSEEGTYQFFLPAGTYYLEVKSGGYKGDVSKIFQLSESTPFNADFSLNKATAFNFFNIFSLKHYSDRLDVTLKKTKYPKNVAEGNLLGSVAGGFRLPSISGKNYELSDFRGDNLILSFIGTWSPPSNEEIKVIDELISNKTLPIVGISTQETLSKVSIFAKKGGYNLDIVVDKDGTLVPDYNINSLPTHLFLDRSGKIKKIVTGVLNKEELISLYESI